VADHVIGALDSNGFLTETDAEIADATGVSLDEVEQVLAAMKGLEPIGIGSRSITESLLAQLEFLRELESCRSPIMPRRSSEASRRPGRASLPRGRGSRRHHPARGDRHLAVREGQPQSVSHRGLHRGGERRQLAHARPARRPDPDDRRRADRRGRRVAPLQPARCPIYSALSSKLRSNETTEDEKQHVRQYVGRAKFFIDNINRRRATIQRIAEALVDRQRDYLVHGVQHLVPLTRAEVGELIGMHESTVSRATAEKYVMVPSGEVVPFSHFFTASLGVKDQIRRMIEAEDPSHPLSDQEIADALAADGVALARRTVAKYRDELQILPARLRHR
jgi:RNA polymerase sigma-54 factor